MKVYKYQVPIQSEFTIEMPSCLRILSCQAQNNIPQIWALVDEKYPIKKIKFRMIGTGHEADNISDMDYIDTIQLNQGTLVFHIFVEKFY